MDSRSSNLATDLTTRRDLFPAVLTTASYHPSNTRSSDSHAYYTSRFYDEELNEARFGAWQALSSGDALRGDSALDVSFIIALL